MAPKLYPWVCLSSTLFELFVKSKKDCELMKALVEARDNGCEFLKQHLHQDGSFGDGTVQEYYKVAVAFQVCGLSQEANRLLNWVRHNGITSNGDFGPRTVFTDGYSYAYFNTWIVIGAARLGQFDIARKGMDFLMSFYDRESGGFYSDPTARQPDTMQDLWVTSGCGQAALYTSRLDVARGVGRWMNRMMDEQPNYPEEMYTVMTPGGGLVTDVDPCDPIRYVLVNATEGDQYFFHPGIAAGFLARLYQATGEALWLTLSTEYMRFAENATDYMYRLLRAGKVMWAAAVLWTLTREGKYRDIAIKVGRNIVDSQHAEGWWCMPGEEGVPNDDVTAEMVVWLDEAYQAIT